MVCRNPSCFLSQLTFSLGKPISTLVSAVCLVELSLIALFDLFAQKIFCDFCACRVLLRIASYCLVSRAVQPSHRVGFLLPRLGRTIRSAIHPVDGLPGMNPKQMMPDASANICANPFTPYGVSILNRSVNKLNLLRHAALWHLSCSCGHSIFSGSRCRSCARSSGGAQEAS